MSILNNTLLITKSMLSNWRMVSLKPSLILFLLKYMVKFHMINVSDQLILHSHLPAVNSKAFKRFVQEHLLNKTKGPSHAQIGVTNVCPQHCSYCYNKQRSGTLLSTNEIISLVHDLKNMGVFWIGFTGGEPLMNQDIVKIVKSAGDDCALKLFTTGAGLTSKLAKELKQAGLLYVSVSLDHWKKEIHNKSRGLQTAFQTAVRAIHLFKQAGIHVSVSSVISKEMIQNNQVPRLLRFLIKLGVHEAWLSEVKPVSEELWQEDSVITEQERASIIRLQNIYNKKHDITVNYLGHFEDGTHFGCNAGNKMIYIDSFGEVSPCVFIPMTFGNVHHQSIQKIFSDIRSYFPSESNCFINHNYQLLKAQRGKNIQNDSHLFDRNESLEILKHVSFSPLSAFSRLNK